MNWPDTRDFLTPCFPEPVRSELQLLAPGELREIRVRAGRPTVFVTAARTAEIAWIPGPHQLTALAEALSGHSLYAREDETSRGFVTLAGGHRMGLTGRVVRRGGRALLAEPVSLCIRIAAQWPGAADPLLPHASSGALVIGPPGSGKTTLLRDLARQIATGERAVSIVDERGEIAACADGAPQLDVGQADVLTGLSKPDAVPWLLRSMAPAALITDEIASDADAACLLDAHASGVSVFASAHGTSLTDAASRPALASLMARRVFGVYVVLSGAGGGVIRSLHDRSGAPLSAG